MDACRTWGQWENFIIQLRLSFREFLDGRVLLNLALHNQTTTVNAASVTAFKHSCDKHIVRLNMGTGNRNL